MSIHLDVPVSVNVQELRPRPADQAALTQLLTELEFFSLVKKLVAGAGGGASRCVPVPAAADAVAAASRRGGTSGRPHVLTSIDSVPVVDDPSLLPGIVARLREAPLVALDTQTNARSPRGAELIGLSLAASPTEVWYFPFGHRPQGGELAAPGAGEEPAAAVRSRLPAAGGAAHRSRRAEGRAHQVKFDWQVLRSAGVELAGVTWDSMLAAFLIDSGRRSYDLDVLSLEYLGRTMQSYVDVAGRGKGEIPFSEIPVAAAAAYGGNESATVLALHAAFAPALTDTPMGGVLDNVEIPLTPVLVDMEWAGVQIDLALFKRLSNELARDLEQLQVEIAAGGGREPQPQLAAAARGGPLRQAPAAGAEEDQDGPLHRCRRARAARRHGARPAAAHPGLSRTAEAQVAPTSTRCRSRSIRSPAASTPASTRPAPRPGGSRRPIPTCRTSRCALPGARRSGAASCPPRATASWWPTTARSSCASWRTCRATRLFIEAFQQGGDIHRQTAAVIFGVPVEQVNAEQRARAKTINFATIYGQGPFALSKQLGITQEEAKQFIAQYFERFAGVRAFLDRQVALAQEQGYVETLLGRRRYIPEVREKNFNLRSYGERNAQNSPLQGSAADLIKLAMIRIHALLAERRPGEPHAAAGARRTGVRGAAGRGGDHGGAGEAGDGIGDAAPRAAGGRRGCGGELAGREELKSVRVKVNGPSGQCPAVDHPRR